LGGGAKDKYRFDYLLQFYREAVQKSTYIDTELRDEATKIVIAKYLFGNGPSFDDNMAELLDKVKLQDFMVAGIQFRPLNNGYPTRGGNWYNFFKWSYPQFKTVNFLVKYMMDGKNQKLSPFQLPSKGKDLKGKIIYYKSLELNVNAIKPIPENNNTQDISTITRFSPKGVDPQMEVYMANIPLDDDGKVYAKNPYTKINEEIMDDTIVEFAYERIYGEFTNIFKWTPLRVNHWRTRIYREGENNWGTTDGYANHLWNAFTNLVTETHLRDGNVPEEDISNIYYANNTMRLKKFPFQVFHNRIVKDNLISRVAPAIINHSQNMMGSLLDLACGSGGDFAKWKLALLKNVVGIDYVKENIETAIALFKKARRPKPDVFYIWGDISKLIFPDFDTAMDFHGKEQMKKIFLSKYQYDIVSIQFAIHYIFESEITLRILLQNVTDNLKIGGHFVGTCLDGEKVNELLGKKKEGEKVVGMVGEDLLWTITKEYDLKKWDSKKANLGNEINVFVSTIGVEHKEYLVNFDYLKDLAKEYGLDVVSIRNFGDIYDEALMNKTEWDEDLRNISGGEKLFSFMHNEFTFVKTKNASDQTYQKLQQLIKKKEKKDERISKFNNKRIKITIRSGGSAITRKNIGTCDITSKTETQMATVDDNSVKDVNIDNSVKEINVTNL